MWVFTDEGYYSVAVHPNDAGTLMVRGRVPSDLTPVAEAAGTTIEETKERDYPYRVYISRSEWAEFLTTRIDRMDYDKFKDSVLVRQGKDRYELYLRVWGVLTGLAEQTRTVPDLGETEAVAAKPMEWEA